MSADLKKRFLPVLSLASALLIALAWPAHVLSEDNPADKNCPVCLVVCSPELNSDCGTELLSAPADFVLAPVVRSLPVVFYGVSSVFLSRAPPRA
ncbi:MAG TPA: hypothetical protein DDW67_09295 [Elusimicrobia bacterium]|jgi:hypothetical protein|nr:hypothetical protein [Elusimicrobiota bacterium]